LNFNGGVTVAFGADHKAVSPRLFGHLSQLAAECWLKAATRWQTVPATTARLGPPQARTAVGAKHAKVIILLGTPEST